MRNAILGNDLNYSKTFLFWKKTVSYPRLVSEYLRKVPKCKFWMKNVDNVCWWGLTFILKQTLSSNFHTKIETVYEARPMFSEKPKKSEIQETDGLSLLGIL